MTPAARTDPVPSPPPARRHEIEVLGARTRYWVYGPADADSTILMIHGFRGDHHGLERLAHACGNRRVVVPDLPGFGESEPLSRPHDLEGFTAWLRAFATPLLSDGPTAMLGHSFGSIIVAASLAAEPGPGPAPRPRHVVLVNPIGAPALAGPRGILTRLAVLYYRAGARLPERLGLALLRNRLIVRVMSQAMAKTRDRALRGWIHDQHRRYFSTFSDRRSLLEAFRTSVGTEVGDFAARIPEPTLLVAAERDDITPLSAQRRLVEAFPDARLVVVPEVGHLVHYEAPGFAAEAIEDFLGH